MSKKTTRGKDRTIIIACIIIGVILFTVLFAAFGIPVISSNIKMSRTLDAFDDFSENDYIIVRDPSFEGRLSVGTVEVTLTGNDARELLSRLDEATEKRSYSGSENHAGGEWDICITGNIGGKTVWLYLCENRFYVVSDYKHIFFTPIGSSSAAYSSFYSEITGIIENNAE